MIAIGTWLAKSENGWDKIPVFLFMVDDPEAPLAFLGECEYGLAIYARSPKHHPPAMVVDDNGKHTGELAFINLEKVLMDAGLRPVPSAPPPPSIITPEAMA